MVPFFTVDMHDSEKRYFDYDMRQYSYDVMNRLAEVRNADGSWQKNGNSLANKLNCYEIGQCLRMQNCPIFAKCTLLYVLRSKCAELPKLTRKANMTAKDCVQSSRRTAGSSDSYMTVTRQSSKERTAAPSAISGDMSL